jgi:tetratricopeptide (TPR) repeat protein
MRHGAFSSLFVGVVSTNLFLASCAPQTIAAPLVARKSVAVPVEQAEYLIRQSKFDEALNALRSANGLPSKSPYEIFIVAETKAAVHIHSGDYGKAINPIEVALGTGVLSKEAALANIEDLVFAENWVGDSAGVIKYGERYYRDGGTATMPRQLMANVYYRDPHFRKAASTMRNVIDEELSKGERPDESQLQMLAYGEYQLKDKVGYEYALEHLLAYYPKPEYWKALLTALPWAQTFPDRMVFELDRLKLATGVFDTPRSYMAMAEMALEAGLPGEARAVLAEGRAAHILAESGDVEREDRLAAIADREARAAAANLPLLAKRAFAVPSGEASVSLAANYASFGQYRQAIVAFKQGLAKGGLRHPNVAKLDLGIADIMAGDPQAANAALESVTGAAATLNLAGLWMLRSAQQNTKSILSSRQYR